MHSIKFPEQKKIRVFAGPNGSGKSTVIDDVRKYQTPNGLLDFGYYVNADDIASALRTGAVRFKDYEIKAELMEFRRIVEDSGLLNNEVIQQHFTTSFTIQRNRLEFNPADEQSLEKTEYLIQRLAK